jgi:spore coat polysaccharide biosynthesis protein SpsF
VSRVERTGVVVQMRLDSTRLPGKALLRIGGTNLAGMVLRRLRTLAVDEYVLATDSDGARALAETAREFGFSVFEGPKDDVLARYAMASKAFGLERVVRATGDNPFVSVVLAAGAIKVAKDSGADYVGFVGMPVGMGVEVVTVSALAKAALEATSAFEREHVCPYLYGNPHVFSIQRPVCPAAYRLPEARVTVDTPADFMQAEAIVSALGAEPSDAALLAWLKNLQKGA